MKQKKLLLTVFTFLTSMSACAQTTITLLPGKDSGPWPCAYYLLNSNDELQTLSPADWTSRCTDESDWIAGYGPLSNSPDDFRVTPWGSEVQPLLVRRHFTLTADDMAVISKSTLTLTCSYDENPHFYLNGVSLWSYTGWNDNDYAARQFNSRHMAQLREGDNVISVSLMQGAGGGHIDFSLTMTRPDTPDGIVGHKTDEDNRQGAVYSIGGVQQEHPANIYIKNNKKFIQKK